MLVEVYIYSQSSVSSVYAEEADFMIKSGRACYPQDVKQEKAIEPTYQNKMVEAPTNNKRGRKAK